MRSFGEYQRSGATLLYSVRRIDCGRVKSWSSVGLEFRKSLCDSGLRGCNTGVSCVKSLRGPNGRWCKPETQLKFDRTDGIYLTGTAVIGVGVWQLSSAWALISIGLLLLFPVVLGWVRLPQKK